MYMYLNYTVPYEKTKGDLKIFNFVVKCQRERLRQGA